MLGIQLGTVKSRLHYALRSLRVHLEGTAASAAPTCPADEAEVKAS